MKLRTFVVSALLAILALAMTVGMALAEYSGT